MDRFLQVLKGNLMKITPRRKAVIKLFLKNNTQMKPCDVHKRLRKTLPKIGLPTVYRILDELKDIGILVQVLSEDRQLHYSLCSIPDEHHHHHFICTKCKKTEEVDYCNFSEISRLIEKNLKCKVESHLLQIKGLCTQCR
ncbi:MAG: Fur family transcriptional regulator [Phycisphaerae bacterium]|jgi:Fur family zinc uptake transcriptional regulator/Fur family ferric uptake transcriptional regulator